MPEPNEARANQILDNIELVLGQIRKQDGYWFDIGANQVSTERKSPDEISAADMPYLEMITGPSTQETIELPTRDEETMEVAIDGIIEQGDAKLRSRDRERCIRDVKKKLQEDTHRGELKGSPGVPLARWTAIRTIERADGDGAYASLSGFRMLIEIRFKYSWATP